MSATFFFLSPPPPNLSTKTSTASQRPLPTLSSFSSLTLKPTVITKTPRRDFRVFADDQDDDFGDGIVGDPDDFEMEEDEAEEEVEVDYDLEYQPLSAGTALSLRDGNDDLAMINTKNFMSTRGWDSEMIVDYRINEDEFHKIRLMDCDFFIRKPPDPDDNVYDFREMYVTPPDTDIYSIPKVLAPMPQKYIRCAKSDYGTFNVTEPPIDAPRDPLAKSEWEVMKVFLTKHYRNRRVDDPDFMLDFEEIYVIDSKTKSITRAKVLVTVPEGRNRDRKKDFLVVRDNGTTFKIIPMSEREDPSTVIHNEEWNKTRQDMEKHLRKLRDFNVSNWF